MELCLPQLAPHPAWHPSIQQRAGAIRVVAPRCASLRLIRPSGLNAIFRISTAEEFGSNGFESARPYTCRTACVHSNIIKLKCRTSKFDITTAMPSNPRRIVCPMVAFHPTYCSNSSTASEPKAATGFIRSITSRAKSKRCSTRPSGRATGWTCAVEDGATVRNTSRTGRARRVQQNAPKHHAGTRAAHRRHASPTTPLPSGPADSGGIDSGLRLQCTIGSLRTAPKRRVLVGRESAFD